jgi:hypothetical protein
MLRRALLVQALAGALLLLVAGAAGAHTSGPMPSPPAPAPAVHAASLAAATPGATVPLWPWLAPLALAPVLLRRRAPRLVAATLAVVLVVFAAESAVHSVHHGLAGREPAACPVASAAMHLTGTDVESVGVALPVLAAGPPLAEPGPRAATLRPLSPHQGRAPPSALAA